MPTFAPRFAVRRAIGFEHNGQMGACIAAAIGDDAGAGAVAGGVARLAMSCSLPCSGELVPANLNWPHTDRPVRHDVDRVSSMNLPQAPPLNLLKEIDWQDRRREVREAIPAASDRHNPRVPCRAGRLQALGADLGVENQAALEMRQE